MCVSETMTWSVIAQYTRGMKYGRNANLNSVQYVRTSPCYKIVHRGLAEQWLGQVGLIQSGDIDVAQMPMCANAHMHGILQINICP